MRFHRFVYAILSIQLFFIFKTLRTEFQNFVLSFSGVRFYLKKITAYLHK